MSYYLGIMQITEKHVQCFYRVMETRANFWENEKCSGNTSRGRVFPKLFRVLPNWVQTFTSVFIKQLDYELEISIRVIVDEGAARVNYHG